SSILILMESITGLLMNEPWLIGQSQVEGRGNFQPGQMNQTTAVQSGTTTGSSPTTGQAQGQTSGQATENGQTQGQMGSNSNGQLQGSGGFGGGPGGDGASSGSFMSIIKGLHQGRIGTTNIKWLVDLAALAMIFLTGSGIFLSLKVLGAEKKRKKRKTEELLA
ncbi:MAG: PepSY domain-containing protein, partial [Neobacillus sp.]